LHLTDGPQNLLANVVDDEDIKIGTLLDVRVKRLEGNKVRLFLSFQKNELEEASLNEIRVLGNGVQTIQDVELSKPAKVVYQKDASGAAQRWVEITVDEIAVEEKTAPPPAIDGRKPSGSSREKQDIKAAPSRTLEGAWSVVEEEKDGKKTRGKVLKQQQTRFDFRGASVSISATGTEATHYTFELNNASDGSNQIDLFTDSVEKVGIDFNEKDPRVRHEVVRGKFLAYRGIYSLDGDTLILCLAPATGNRPRTFRSDDRDRVLYRLQKR
jgi:uncharacterized protein (TIGR03067 family)